MCHVVGAGKPREASAEGRTGRRGTPLPVGNYAARGLGALGGLVWAGLGMAAKTQRHNDNVVCSVK